MKPEPLLGVEPSLFSERDAIHIAIYPARRGKNVKRGDYVNVVDGVAEKATRETAIGIADPFAEISRESVWVCLFPRSTDSLRHDWTHPSLPRETATEDRIKTDAYNRIAGIADRLGSDAEELIEAAKNYMEHGDYWCEGGRFEGEHIEDGFWDAFDIVTGMDTRNNDRGNFLSCSC